MKKRVGILTSGGDCPGLNATIRGVAKALYARMGDNVEIIGILNGYSGLINGDYKEMCEERFRRHCRCQTLIQISAVRRLPPILACFARDRKSVV